MKLFEVSSPVEAALEERSSANTKSTEQALRQVLLTLAKFAPEPFKKYNNDYSSDANSPTAYYSGVAFESDRWIKIWTARSNAMHRDLIVVKAGQRKSELEAKRYISHDD